MKRDSYVEKEKRLMKLLECDKVIITKRLCLVEVDIYKDYQRHSYIIKANGIDSNSNDVKLNKLIIKHNSKLIDLARYKMSDDEVLEMIKEGYQLSLIYTYTPATSLQVAKVNKRYCGEVK